MKANNVRTQQGILRHWPWLLPLCIVVGGGVAWLVNDLKPTKTEWHGLTLPKNQQKSFFNQNNESWQQVTIQSGDTLTSLFQQLHLSMQTLADILQNPIAKQYIAHLMPGEQLRLLVDQNRALKALDVKVHYDKFLLMTLVKGKWQAKLQQLELQQTLGFTEGAINSNFSAAAQKIGMHETMTAEFIHIFSDKVNFDTLRPGTRFKLLYNEYYSDGHLVKVGHIAYALLIGKHHTYQAIRFPNNSSDAHYYTPQGHSLRLSLLRYPTHFTRISSRFTYHRLDPILHVYRPHLGVDLAAPEGTPIFSVGDGRVVFCGKKGGYGNAMVIDYGRHYQILFGHMEKFARHWHPGDHVHMYETIGYIGSTGWSTGPHIHYEIHFNGKPVNPVTLKLPFAPSITRHERTQFNSLVTKLKTAMQGFQH